MSETIVLDQENQRDFERQTRLEEGRAEDKKEEKGGMRRALKRLSHLRRSMPHVGFVEGGLISFVAVAADIIDYLVIGLIPVVGDILDVAVWMLIAVWVWSRGIKRPRAALLSGIIELIPVLGDLVPTWTFMALAIILYNNMVRRGHEKHFLGVLKKVKKNHEKT